MHIKEEVTDMEAMALCEEEVYVELCRMEEPPALEEMRAAVNMREKCTAKKWKEKKRFIGKS